MTFRADIDVSTCGRISPLNALNYLLDSFDSDIVTLDYRVRGFTRDVNGKKLFIDHRINSIQNYIAPATRNRYDMIDVNVYQENIFHTKMVLHDFDLDNYLFNITKDDAAPAAADTPPGTPGNAGNLQRPQYAVHALKGARVWIPRKHCAASVGK